MKKPSAATRTNKSKSHRSGPTKLPVRWVEIPHEQLYQRARNALAQGSRERAKQDALRHVLIRRLPELDPGDHRQYVEIECCKIVETLRAIRDEYRRYLEEEGCKPIAEMYWVVFRFGIVQYAVRLLRDIAFEYVFRSKVPFEEWEILYGLSFIPKFPLSGASNLPDTPNPTVQSLCEAIQGLVREETLRGVSVGGPFGKDGQLILTKRTPGFDFWGPQMTFPDIVKARQLLWDQCCPWTEGLSRLFDSTQEELNFQYSLLAEDAKRMESAFVKLSPFEKIAHEYLVDMRKGIATRNLTESEWLKVLDALDKNGISLEAELMESPRQVLEAVRRRGQPIASWKDCYGYTARLFMDDGRNRSLRREVTHAIHNAAKKASYKLAKVWKGNR